MRKSSRRSMVTIAAVTLLSSRSSSASVRAFTSTAVPARRSVPASVSVSNTAFAFINSSSVPRSNNEKSFFSKYHGTTTTIRNRQFFMSTTTEPSSFKRSPSKHRNIISNGNGNGNDNDDKNTSNFPAEANRYHLHVALACPWACGVLAMVKLKGLDHVISYSIVHPTWGKTKPDDDDDKHWGWIFKNPGDDPISNPLGHGSFECDDALIPDTVTNCKSVREIYELCGDYDGPFTTPVLYDMKTQTIVNNESTEILRMLNFEFNEFAKYPNVNLYPDGEEEEKQLMELNDSLIYPKVNNGVYKCGFAHSQGAYDIAVTDLFEALEELEVRLGKTRYLTGNDHFTWLDLRLFMTLVRFDPVYTCYFKTNKKRLVDYPNLLGYVRDIYSMDAIKGVNNMSHIKTHYFTSHPVHNTFGIIPVYDGPDLNESHGRDKME